MPIKRVITVVVCLSLGFVSLAQATVPPPPTIDNIFQGMMDKLLNASLLNQKLDSTATATVEPSDVVILNHAAYCSKDSALPGQDCQQGDPSLENADIQASTLLELPTIPDSDAGRDWAARVFMRNMTNSTKKFNTYQFSEVVGPTKDKDKAIEYAQGLLGASILSVPATSLATMYASRKLGTTYKDQTNPDAPASSLMSYMSQIAGRIQDPEWMKNLIKISDPLVIQRMQVGMQAEQLFMTYQKYKQGERIEALLSAIVVQNQRQAEAGQDLLAQGKAAALTPSAKAAIEEQKKAMEEKNSTGSGTSK